MAEDKKRQAAAERKYRGLKRAVEEAGFHAPSIDADSDSDRLVCCSKHKPGHGFTGRIAFVTKAGRRWYIATPHPFHYRVLDSTKVSQAVVDFLNGEGTLLEQIDDEEYTNAVGHS